MTRRVHPMLSRMVLELPDVPLSPQELRSLTWEALKDLVHYGDMPNEFMVIEEGSGTMIGPKPSSK